jgi:hypothetical protein
MHNNNNIMGNKMLKLKHINKKRLKDYCRQLGLACVLGSFTGLFLHSVHHYISLAMLFMLGVTSSYYGLLENISHDNR